MNTQKKRNLSDVVMTLQQEEPYPRLKEFCKLGNYRYTIFWDVFKNGRLITCEIFYYINGHKRTIHRETQFVEGIFDNKYFRNVISQSLLHNIGLSSISDASYNETPTPSEVDLNSQMMGTVTKILGRAVQTFDEEISKDADSHAEGLGGMMKKISEELLKAT